MERTANWSKHPRIQQRSSKLWVLFFRFASMSNQIYWLLTSLTQYSQLRFEPLLFCHKRNHLQCRTTLLLRLPWTNICTVATTKQSITLYLDRKHHACKSFTDSFDAFSNFAPACSFTSRTNGRIQAWGQMNAHWNTLDTVFRIQNGDECRHDRAFHKLLHFLNTKYRLRYLWKKKQGANRHLCINRTNHFSLMKAGSLLAFFASLQE